MNEGFEKLKGIGAQKIHENTHISKLHAQAILNESFENMTKIQLFGFLSILEREYDVKLEPLKEKATEYFQEGQSDEEEEVEHKVFVEPSQKKNMTKSYVIIAAVLLFVAILFSIFSSSSSSTTTKELDNSVIESAKVTIAPQAQELVTEEIIPEKVEPAVVESFIIKPKSKLWVGYIELGTHKKNQKTITDELVLDPTKDWLLSLGHGHVDFEIDGETISFKDRKNIRLLYRDGTLNKIDFEEFKRLNKGNEW